MTPLHRLVAAFAVGVFAATQGSTSFGAAQLFKCIDGGRTVYQQQACSVAQPEPAASAPPATRASADVASAAARKLRSASPASSAPATSR